MKKVSQYKGFNKNLLTELIDKIAKGEKLDIKYKDHALAKHSPSMYQGGRDFHLAPNIAIVYRLTDQSVQLLAIGSHQDLGLTEALEIR